jgi:hypothetical protein
MNTRSNRQLIAVVATGLVVSLALVGAIALTGPGPSAETDASVPPSQIAIVSPGASGLSPDPSASPAPSSNPTPQPKPAVWGKPHAIKGLDNCVSVVAAIDDFGTNHLAATCGSRGGEIRYSVSTDGRTWKTTTFKPPTNRFEQDPQLAVDGKTLYLAYTRLAPEDGSCGDDGLADVGVYYRTRALPNGGWSAPKRLGEVADHLQSIRVRGTIHATVTNENAAMTWYETLAAGTFSRYAIPDAAGRVSLRVGDEGKARIAYEGPNGIEYGVFAKRGFSTEAIPGSAGGWDPVLALAPGNAAYVIWNRSDHGGGCVSPGPMPADGTYFATNASGHWVSRRLTKVVGGASLALDPVTSKVHALITDYERIIYYERSAGGAWRHLTLVKSHGSSPVIREYPKTGNLLVAYVASRGDEFIVEVITKR